MVRQGCSYAELDISTFAKWKKLVPMEERGMAICGAPYRVYSDNTLFTHAEGHTAEEGEAESQIPVSPSLSLATYILLSVVLFY